MGTNTQLIDLPTFKGQILENVKTQFVNLIPEDTMNSFITKTIKDFEENELPNLVLVELRKHASASIKILLSEQQYGMWNGPENLMVMSPEIENILIKAAPTMFAEILRQTAQNTFMSMNNNVPQY